MCFYKVQTSSWKFVWDDLGDVHVTQDLLGDVHVQDLLDMLKSQMSQSSKFGEFLLADLVQVPISSM